MKMSIVGRNIAARQLGEAFESLGVEVVGATDAVCAPLDLVRDPAVEALVIGCPLAGRFSLALEALSRGKHVLVAGALRQPWEASVLVRRALDQRRVLDFALPALLDTERAQLARTAAELDTVRLVTARRGWDGRDWSDAWDVLADEVARLHLLFGEAPSWASAIASPASPSEEPADAVTFTLGFADERMAQIQLLAGASGNSMLAHAAAGPVRIDIAGFHLDEDELAPAVEIAGRFVDAVSAGSAPPPAVPEGVFRAIEAAQQSLRETCGEVRL